MTAVLLGVTGSIAAYKTPELIRQLSRYDIRVIPVLTRAAEAFVAPLSLSTVAQRRAFVHGDFFDPSIPHLDMSSEADVLVIAPASADFIARCAHGLADDLLSAMFLSFTGPKIMVPAMHTEMWENPATQDNVARLRGYGVRFFGPDSGELACGDVGSGRMADVSAIVQLLRMRAYAPLSLLGKQLLISAGGTRERLDSVRTISNLSTGQLGHALAYMASWFGASVDLVSTTAPLAFPGVRVTSVSSVADMKAAMESLVGNASHLFMAAAVSDYTAAAVSEQKIRRSDHLSIELKGTPDILLGLSELKQDKCFVGFCLEDHDLKTRAQEKLHRKNLDYIVANTSDNIGNDRRSFTLYSKTQLDGLSFKDLSVLDSAYEILRNTIA